MGLDIGTKYIGVAVSDETGTLAQGKGVVRRKPKDDSGAIEEIKGIAEEYEVKEIVVGLPLNMNGTIGERARDSADFAEKLKKETALRVKLWDERLSTKEVEDILVMASVTRNRRKKVTDKLAAQIILQSYLDSLRIKKRK